MSVQTFEYTVVAGSGKEVTGRIEAPDEQAVAARLRELGMVATEIVPVQTTGLRREIRFGTPRVKGKDVALVIRQLSTMVAAGLSLPRAMQVLRAQAQGGALADILKAVEDDLAQGTSLSHALGKHPRDFSPVVISMVQAGETGGFLDEVLDAVATTLERELALQAKIKSAMVYPVVVLVFAGIAVTAMLLFIVPVFKDIFEGLGAELPFATQMLVTAADIFRFAAGPLVVGIVLGLRWWRRHRNDLAVRERLDPLRLRLPIFGPLFRKIAVARFAGNLSTMTRVGVPVVPALRTVGATSGNLVIERAVDRACEAVQGGTSLGAALAAEEIFPVMLRQMVAVGEDSGSLDGMLARVAGFYDDEVETATASLTSAMEPLLIVVIGVIVGSMMIALYMPIFMLSTAME